MKYFKLYFQKEIKQIIYFTLIISSIIVIADEIINSGNYPSWISWFNWVLVGSIVVMLIVYHKRRLRIWQAFIIYAYIFTIDIYLPGILGGEELRTIILSSFSNLGACLIYLVLTGIVGGGVHVLYLGGLNITMQLILILTASFLKDNSFQIDYINLVMFTATPFFVFVVFNKIEKSIAENEYNKKKILEQRTQLFNLKIDEEQKRNQFLSIVQSENDLLVSKVISRLTEISEEPNEEKIRNEIANLRQHCISQGYQINKTENVKWNIETDSGFIAKLKSKYPDLNQKEQYICSLLRLNMNTQEIADKLNMSPETIKWYRKRIRKKIHLKEKKNLSTYFRNL